MTTILGISAFYHDSAAALIRDGEIIAAAQETRFSRRKPDPGFPSLAVAYCLREGRIRAKDLTAVAFYEKPMVKFERLVETYLAYAPTAYASFREAIPVWVQLKLDLPNKIRRELGPEFKGEIYFADPPESHSASAFFPSPFDEAAILTLDAVGEWSPSSIGIGRGNKIELMQEMRFPHSLGMLYTSFTYYTGFKVNSGEYKLMGLAPYGRPNYADVIREKIVSLKEDGSIELDMSYFNYCQALTMTSDKFHDLFGGPPRQPETLITQKEMDLAASIQVVCEEVVLAAAAHTKRLSGSRNLVMAGGVALNCVANGRLTREGDFDQIWVQPAAGGAGGALGAALLVWHHVMGHPRKVNLPDAQKGSLLGPNFQNEDIELFLDSVGAAYESVADEEGLLARVANFLDEGKVIGWFYGRM